MKNQQTHASWTRRIVAALAAIATVAACLVAGAATGLDGAQPALATPNGKALHDVQPASDVVVIAFQQNWNSIAKECTDVLGPEYVGYVEVSPPQESIQGSEWWTSYQPVSYSLDSKEGTEEEFKNMIATCNAAGVGVIADAITNHMAAAPADGSDQGIGVAGSTYTGDGDFPAVPWTSADFHSCTDAVSDYKNVRNVQECRLDGLQDLNTGDEHVQDVLAGYLAKLYDMGVSGFRMDAIKHIAPEDVAAIKQKTAQKLGVDEDRIWWMQEVIDDSGNAQELMPSNYLSTGDASEFRFTYDLKAAFGLSVASLKRIGTGGYVSSDKAQVFVSNWDTERSNNSLSYKDGKKYLLANAFMLAYGYGTPNIQSGYVFSNRNTGAPGATATSVPDTQCGAGSPWLCVERWTSIRGMIKFHANLAGAPVTDWWDDGANNIAFGRGDAGFFAMNNSNQAVTTTYKTSMPAGTYCNVYAAGDCSQTVTVADDGTVTATLEPYSALAISHTDTPETWTGTAASDPSDPTFTSTGAFDDSAIDMTYGGVYAANGASAKESASADPHAGAGAVGAGSDGAGSDGESSENSPANTRARLIIGAVVIVIALAVCIPEAVRRHRAAAENSEAAN
ncbi:pullulanase [Pseudoscardovia radai]|uniref:Alpha-amylase n=1 Tax=Pseudoscardovia radai TaxID=987066 RepID=A0A261EZH5_9BIFI|nr:alpha-amylase family protein [Pseudoscardovia radai]OZG52270.1 pullulanase [Pseudoscardovia radai]